MQICYNQLQSICYKLVLVTVDKIHPTLSHQLCLTVLDKNERSCLPHLFTWPTAAIKYLVLNHNNYPHKNTQTWQDCVKSTNVPFKVSTI